MRAIIGITTTLMLAAWSLPAQEAGLAEQKMKAELEHALVSAKLMSVEGGVMGPAVKGSPYAATEVTESNQVLGDGTKIHNERQTKVYRDGMGRIRRESGEEIVIMDPVNNVRFGLHPKDHTVSKMPMAVTQENMGMQKHVMMMSAGTMATAPDAVFMQTFVNDGVTIGYKAVARAGKTEELGMETMEGVIAQGTRTTRTIETGAIGNDRPINIVNERWYSSDLQTVVMTKQTDPREGETVFKLTGIQRGEPDPSLFQVPAGYQVSEPQSFTTTIRRE